MTAIDTERATPALSDTATAALEAWGAHDLDDPFTLFAKLRRAAPVHRVRLTDGHAAWLVTRYDEARTALADPRLSKDMQAALARSGDVVAEGLPGPAFARHMVNVDPPDHTRLRRLVATAFAHARVEALRPRIQDIVDELLDGMAEAGPDAVVDLMAAFAFPFPFTVICDLLGVPEEHRDWLGDNLTLVLGQTPTPADYARAKTASDIVVGMLTSLVDLKRRSPGDDLVSDLVRARHGDDRLTEQELLSTIFLLIVAGHETTTNTIGNGVVALLRHPDELAALRADPERIAAVLEEIVRLDGPAQHATFRYATEPVELGGVTIPEGDQVLICLAAADRDETRFAEPDRLVVGRTDSRHLGFGHGIHHCLGAGLARMEGQVALGTLLRRFPELRLAVPGGALRWRRGDGVVLRGLSELPVVAGPDAGRAGT